MNIIKLFFLFKNKIIVVVIVCVKEIHGMQKFILERISTEVHQAVEKCQSKDNSLLSTCVFVLDSVSDGDDDDDQAAH